MSQVFERRAPVAGAYISSGWGEAPVAFRVVNLFDRVWRLILALPGSIVFCLRYLPPSQAARLPILVAHGVARHPLRGAVRLASPVRPGMVKIGFGYAPQFDWRRSRGVWRVTGQVVFNGSADISHGAKISGAGRLTVGDGVFLNAESSVHFAEEITIGSGSKISWLTFVTDTDAHSINRRSADEPVLIGEGSLVGAHSVILKGVRLAPHTVVGAGSVVTRTLATQPGDLVAGNPARVVRRGVNWVR